MAVPFSNTKLRVPKGFQNILECLAREVLRSQPDNIHEFGAAYFEKMLRVRLETGHDPAVHGAKLEDRNYNNESFKKGALDTGDPLQNSAAVKIQTQFRQHSAKEEVEAMRQEVAATRIQAGFRGYIDREEVRKMRNGEPEEEEVVDIDLKDPDVEKAAIKIQAGFKGFKARKEAQGQGQEADKRQAEIEPLDVTQTSQHLAEQEEQVDIDLNDPDVAKAAVKIQAGFKGLKARKDLQAKKQQSELEAEPTTQTESSPAQAGSAPGELDDAATENAAVKIQATFRGYQTRKNQRNQDEDGAGSELELRDEGERGEALDDSRAKEDEEAVDIDLTDPEVNKAATKIQAGFKGFKTRKEIQSKGAGSTGVAEVGGQEDVTVEEGGQEDVTVEEGGQEDVTEEGGQEEGTEEGGQEDVTVDEEGQEEVTEGGGQEEGTEEGGQEEVTEEGGQEEVTVDEGGQEEVTEEGGQEKAMEGGQENVAVEEGGQEEDTVEGVGQEEVAPLEGLSELAAEDESQVDQVQLTKGEGQMAEDDSQTVEDETQVAVVEGQQYESEGQVAEGHGQATEGEGQVPETERESGPEGEGQTHAESIHEEQVPAQDGGEEDEPAPENQGQFPGGTV